MTTTFTCDICGAEISEGYTVQWTDNLKDDSTGIVTTSIPDRHKRHVCEDCWPSGAERGLLDGLRRLFT